MILATDLDGTFLGGSAEGRERLYRWLHEAEGSTVIFVTGRGLDRVVPLIDDRAIPTPEYVIADVGATVVHGPTLAPVLPLQQRIEEVWPGTERVRRALAGIDGLRPQEVPMERRVSYWIEEGRVPPRVEEIADELGCDLLVSAGQFLDVLPRGVSKGTTLLALLDEVGLARERVVVAGDTLNDLSLFECDLKGIVVGEAEGALRDQVRALGGAAFLAEGPGCEGILEGLAHHGWLPASVPDSGTTRDALRQSGDPVRQSGDPLRHSRASGNPGAPGWEAAGRDPAPAADRQLVMVYHRLPFDEVVRGGRVERRPPKSPNGIIPTLLGFFEQGRDGLWVAWSKQETREPEGFEPRVKVDEARYPNLTAVRIPLTPGDVNLFYEAFSKEALWPIIFAFPERASFDAEHWDHFLEVNRLFAERTAGVAEEGAIVWVHDYNLWMVPHFLRKLRPDVTIAFFHHTSFPPPDIFNILPWRRQIVDSLLDCDYVGFHIPRYVENFVDVVRTYAPMEVEQRVPCTPRFRSYGCALGIDEVTREITVGDRTVRMGAHPVGINVKAIDHILERPHVQEMTRRIRREMGDRTSILSIERLDYVKGPLEKLEAFELLLEQHPELHRKIVLFTICTPPAPGMRIYRRTRERVDQAVGRINGRFATIDWTPVRYFFRSLPYEEVIAHYAVSDVAWITPLRDGLNMVAKEYVAANHAVGGTGRLVLSEFAGAAAELHGALLTNPYDPQQMADDLYASLRMSEEARKARMATLYDIVDANNVAYWSYEFLAGVEGKI